MGTVAVPVWVFGIVVTLTLAIIGGLIAHVRAFAKLSTAVEHLGRSVDKVSTNADELSKTISTLSVTVAVLVKDVERVESLDNDVRKIKTTLHLVD